MTREKAAEGSEPPSTKATGRRRKAVPGAWNLPPLIWILGAGKTEGAPSGIERILSTTLPEAFLLASSLPESEVVALEPSPELARQARTSAGRRRLRNLNIQSGTLDQPALTELIGGNFSLILAHDVLHREGDLLAALKNLAAACSPEGSVYLGVRGPGHASLRMDEALGSFGLERADILKVQETVDSDEQAGAELKRIAALVMALGGYPPKDAASFAGEISAEGNSAMALASWLEKINSAGLHLCATTLTSQSLPLSLATGGCGSLTSFTLPRLALLLDQIRKPEFLPLVLTRRHHADPPWMRLEELADWKPRARFLSLSTLPKQEQPWDMQAGVEVEIPGVLEPQGFQLSCYMLEIMRRSDGVESLGTLMKQIPHEVTLAEIRDGLYFLHYSFILELLAP